MRRLELLDDAEGVLRLDESAVMAACRRFVPTDSIDTGGMKEETSDVEGGGMMLTEASDGIANRAGGKEVVGAMMESFILAFDRVSIRDLAFRCAEIEAENCGKRKFVEGEGDTGGMRVDDGGFTGGERGVIGTGGAWRASVKS